MPNYFYKTIHKYTVTSLKRKYSGMHIGHIHTRKQNTTQKSLLGWRDGSVKNTGYSSRRPRFDSQHLHGSS